MSGASKVKVFLSGEGRNELGSRAVDRPYQSDDEPGVLQALLARVQPSGWEVGGSMKWSKIRKYRAGGAAHADTYNVIGLAVDALETGCDVLAFTRDVDNEPEPRRAVEEGIARVAGTLPRAPEIIGSVAIPTLEGWILALLGVRGTESLTPRRAEAALVERGVPSKDGRKMAEAVEAADLSAVPTDAVSLHAWISRAEAVLPPLVARRAGPASDLLP